MESSNFKKDALNIIAMIHYGCSGFFLLTAISYTLISTAFHLLQPEQISFQNIDYKVLAYNLTLFVLIPALLFIYGICLQNRKWYVFCLVIASIESLAIPIGTIFGVFAIVLIIKSKDDFLKEKAAETDTI